MTHQANFKTIARVAVGGGIVAAGACAIMAAAPADARTHPNWPGFGSNNTPFPNTKTCPAGNCYQPVVTTGFPLGTAVGLPGNTAGLPQIAANPSGTSTLFQLGVPHWG